MWDSIAAATIASLGSYYGTVKPGAKFRYNPNGAGIQFVDPPSVPGVCAYCDTPRPNYMKRCQSCGAMQIKESQR